MKEQELKFKSVIHMAHELPYFDMDEDGFPYLAIDPGYGIYDCHGHLANTYLFASPIDYWRKTGHSNTLFQLLGMPVDLGQYSGYNMHKNDAWNHFYYVQTALTNKFGPIQHHSAANLLREMDLAGVSHAINLAIDFPFVSSNSDHVLDVYDRTERLLPFVSVHPLDPFWKRKLERYVERGAMGIKAHPELQMVAFDNKRWEPIFRFCREHGLIVFSHTSVSPVEPDSVKGDKVPRSKVDRFEKALDEFGDVTFMLGHGGMMEYRTLIRLAMKYPNCICEIDGQPPHHLEEFFADVDHDRIVAGSDWPVYPLIYQFAKPLIATEGHPELRWKVLHANAARILGQDVTSFKPEKKKKSAGKKKTAAAGK